MSVQQASWPCYPSGEVIWLNESDPNCPYTFPEIVEFCVGLSLNDQFEVYSLKEPFKDHPAGSVAVVSHIHTWIEPRVDHGIVISPKGQMPLLRPTFSASAIGCEMCPLSKSRTMVVEGDGRPGGLMVIGEAPGRDEDRTGTPFVGNSGQLLKASLAELGLSADTYYLTNAVRCRPEDNRDPTDAELEACRFWLEDEIKRVNPKAILALGKIAQKQMALMIFETVPARVFYAMHPAYLLRQPNRRVEWRAQLKLVADYLLGREGPAQAVLEPVWAPGEPDWDSDWLAIDTETNSLEDTHAESLVSIQASDGSSAITYRPVHTLDGSPGRAGLRHIAPAGQVGEGASASVQGEVGPLPGERWFPYVPSDKLLQLETHLGRDASGEPGAQPGGWWQDRATISDPWTGRRVWYHNVRFDAPKIGVDLRNLEAWDDTALIAYVLRYPRVGLKELGPALTGLPMRPITELLHRKVIKVREYPNGGVPWRKPDRHNLNGGWQANWHEILPDGTKKRHWGPRFDNKADADAYLESLCLPPLRDKEREVSEKCNFSEAMAAYPEAAYEYMLKDAVATSLLARKLWPELLREPSLLRYYREIEKPIVPIVYELEQTGVLIDNDALSRLEGTLTEKQAATKRELDGLLGEDLNPNSGKQLANALIDSGLPLRAKTPTGAWATDEAALLKLCRVDKQDDLDLAQPVHYLVNTILQYREYGKLLSTYCRALREKQDGQGRVHASVNQMVCDTNRFSYSDPNLQNIPARGLLGLPFRRVFIAGPGKVIVKADFSQLELRILAHYTREPILVEAYCSEPERDIHAAFAAEWGVDRKIAKNGVFAMAYMAEAETLARTIGIPRERIGPFLKEQRARMPALFGGWKQHIRNLLTMQGYVETLYGWRNYYPLYRSPIRSEAEKALREAGNLPIQGTAGGILKQLILHYDRTREAGIDADPKFVLMVHDEVVFEVSERWAPGFAWWLERAAETINPLSVPLKLEVQIGPNWADVVPWRKWP